MLNRLPGATGLYAYRKVEWDLREAIAVLTIALARKQHLKGVFESPFDRERLDSLVQYIGAGIQVSMVSGGWYYTGQSAVAKEATSMFSDAVSCGDLERRTNYNYSTVELIRWAATLDLSLPELLPEFGMPTLQEVVEYLKAQEAEREAEAERSRRLHREFQQGKGGVTINGPVQSVNQGNDSVSQTFHNGLDASGITTLLAALRQVVHEPSVPDVDRRALAVAIEQVERNAEKPAVQANWLQTAKDTLEGVGAIPVAVAAMKLVMAYLGGRL